MQILLTGGSGYLGSAILRRLVAEGHSVSAVARSDASASAVEAEGATAVRGDASDVPWLTEQMRSAEAVIHAASPNDETSGSFDEGVVRAARDALGAGHTFVMTSGTWIYGSGTGLTETTTLDAPPIVGWRPPVLEQTQELAEQGVRVVVVAPGMLYGHGGGLPAMLLHGPVTSDDPPALIHPGDGGEHVSNVAVDDAADFYALALAEAESGSTFLLTQDEPPTMLEVAEAASEGRGLGGRAVAEGAEQSRTRLGYLADPLLLDQTFDTSAARALGWAPNRTSMLDELRSGSYAASSANS